MRQFHCRLCQVPITAIGKVGDELVCENCNSRQTIPPTANSIEKSESDAPPVLSRPAARPKPPPTAPTYLLVLYAGYLMMLLGVLNIITACFERLEPAIGLVTLGVCLIGFGQLCHCIRDMALLAWRAPKG